jgi:putative SOS response-associated peptidase YedK
MCGRYVSPEQAAIERAWRIGGATGKPLARRFNVAPTDPVPLLALDHGVLVLGSARWGLIPHWWKQEKPPKLSFNARIEEAATKPMWRDPMRFGRCLVPAEGWYEWRMIEETDPQTGEIVKAKQPHYIRRSDERLFCFAGLVSRRSVPGEPEPQLTCAILTTAAAGALAELHDRMPVVLPDDTHEAWLDRRLKDPAQASALALGRQTPDAFTHFAVRKLVNSTRNDGPELIEPLEKGAYPNS